MNLSIFQTLDKHTIYSIFFVLARVVLFLSFLLYLCGHVHFLPFPSRKEGRKEGTKEEAGLRIAKHYYVLQRKAVVIGSQQ